MTTSELFEHLPYSLLDASVYLLVWGVPLLVFAGYRRFRGGGEKSIALEKELSSLAKELRELRVLLARELRARQVAQEAAPEESPPSRFELTAPERAQPEA